MRKLLPLFLLFGLLFGCTVTKQYSVDKEATYSFDDQITLRILDIKEISRVAVGNGSYYPKKGFKFFEMTVEAKNNSDEKAQLKWEKLFVLDTVNRVRYAPEFVMSSSGFNIGGRYNRPLKAQDVVSKRLIYSIQKEVKTEFFGINGTIYSIPHYEVKKY